MQDHDHGHMGLDPRLSDDVFPGCEESRLLLTRRTMMGVTAGLFSWACLPRHAEAFDSDRRLLIINLIGGMDGLHVAYPHQDRETLEVYRGSMLGDRTGYLGSYRRLANSDFVINTSLKNFADWYDRGQATLVHAIAPPLRTRSHFDCQDNLQNCQPGLGNPTKDGWLNRFLAGLKQSEPAFKTLSADGVPLILQGEAPIQSWRGSSVTGLGKDFADKVAATYKASTIPLFKRLGENLESGTKTNLTATKGVPVTTTSGTTATGMMPEPPSGDFTASLRGTARLMKDIDGPRIAVLSLVGLDTHLSQIEKLDAKLRDLDNGLAWFRFELGENNWNNTVVVCVSEFGRTARGKLEGTDHGVGTVALLAGGNVRGGRVIADWPGIRLGNLTDNRDLKATYDIRSLFKGILRDHLGAWRNERFLNNIVFPGSRTIRPLDGLMKTPPPARLQFKA